MKKRDQDGRRGGDSPPKPGQKEAEDREFTAALLESAELDVPPPDLDARVMRGIARRRGKRALGSEGWVRRAALAAGVLAAAAAVALLARRAPKSSGPPITLEPEVPISASNPVANICAHRLRAVGKAPLIDDFEDGDSVMRPFEGRVGRWHEARDSDPKGLPAPPILPTLRPEATADNRLALHSQAGELLDWGASLEVTFEPACYDASAYDGVAFWAKGPGRIYFAAREVRVVGVEWGGSCTSDCYNVHSRRINLEANWRRFEVRWSDLHQRGYDMPPLDAQSLHSLTFLIHPEDTPYDVWIDDVEFLVKD